MARKSIFPVVATIAIVGVVLGVFYQTVLRDSSVSTNTMTTEQAYADLSSKMKRIGVQEVTVAPQLYVANLFGQSSFGRDKRQTNYAALGTALFRAMKEHPNATFRVPYGLGCGLAGGNWVTVLNLIEEAANAWNVNVEIWVLPKK